MRWWTTWPTAWSSSATRCRRRSPASGWTPARTRRGHAPLGLQELPGRPVREAGHQGRQPRRAGEVGRLGQLVRAAGVRSAAVRGDVGRPGRVDQHRRLRRRATAASRAGAASTATRTRKARCCRRRSPSSPTPASPSGIATVNFSAGAGARSSTGSTPRTRPTPRSAYLKYGPMRLFSQIAQDSRDQGRQGALGARATPGPETAEDSRTHFGIFAPGVDAAVPRGADDQPAPLGAQRGAGRCSARRSRPTRPIVALHLTRPPIEIPDREALGMPSHFEAAKRART